MAGWAEPVACPTLSKYAKALLFEAAPTDPLTISIAAAVLMAVAALAGNLPARRGRVWTRWWR